MLINKLVIISCIMCVLGMSKVSSGGTITLENDTQVKMDVRVDWVNHPHGPWVDPRTGRIHDTFPVCGAELGPSKTFTIQDRDIAGMIVVIVWHYNPTPFTLKKANGYRVEIPADAIRAVFRPFSFNFYSE